MKNILYILLFISSVGYSQTPITDDNFNEAIADCLSTHPVTGLCVDSEYGPMPDWDVSNVTDMVTMFYEATSLLDSGVLTIEEFNIQKSKVLK